jgi:hypothetical protein
MPAVKRLAPEPPLIVHLLEGIADRVTRALPVLTARIVAVEENKSIFLGVRRINDLGNNYQAPVAAVRLATGDGKLMLYVLPPGYYSDRRKAAAIYDLLDPDMVDDCVETIRRMLRGYHKMSPKHKLPPVISSQPTRVRWA